MACGAVGPRSARRRPEAAWNTADLREINAAWPNSSAEVIYIFRKSTWPVSDCATDQADERHFKGNRAHQCD
jgi:hypothetical protein